MVFKNTISPSYTCVQSVLSLNQHKDCKKNFIEMYLVN